MTNEIQFIIFQLPEEEVKINTGNNKQAINTTI